MAQLEYRLFDPDKEYPLLYYYESIKEEEICTRFQCDYFVKDGRFYEKTSCAIEAATYVIYVTEFEGSSFNERDDSQKSGNLRLEIRRYFEEVEEYPIIFVMEFKSFIDLQLYLQCDYLTWMGREWEKSSTEIDEDRKVFVYYAKLVK